MLFKPTNSMIGKDLNLKGASLVDVFILRDTPEESEAFFKSVHKQVLDIYYPVLTGYITLQRVVEKAHECKTIEELEALKWDLFPENMFEQLVEIINGIEELKDSERMYALIHIGDRMIFSITQYVSNILQQRAQTIAAKPKNKIITT